MPPPTGPVPRVTERQTPRAMQRPVPTPDNPRTRPPDHVQSGPRSALHAHQPSAAQDGRHQEAWRVLAHLRISFDAHA